MRRTRNPAVPGSSPVLTTVYKGRMSSWFVVVLKCTAGDYSFTCLKIPPTSDHSRLSKMFQFSLILTGQAC